VDGRPLLVEESESSPLEEDAVGRLFELAEFCAHIVDEKESEWWVLQDDSADNFSLMSAILESCLARVGGAVGVWCLLTLSWALWSERLCLFSFSASDVGLCLEK